jgi:apolipoprotein N-acyltransferase
LAALVPYYVNHLLVLIIEQKHEALLGTLIMIWAVMFALAIYRMFHKGELAVMVVAAALLFVLGLQYPVFSGFWEGSSEQPAIQAEFLKTQKSLLDRQSDLDSKLTEQIKIQSQLFEALRSERQRNEGPPPEIPE